MNFHTTYQQARLIQIRVATEALYFPSILLVHMTHFSLFGGAGHQCIREKARKSEQCYHIIHWEQ